jgi:hypothetical protein
MFFGLQLVTIFGFPYDKKFSKALRSLWSLFPPNVFAEALNYLGLATSTAQDPGIKWKDRSKWFCFFTYESFVPLVHRLISCLFLWLPSFGSIKLLTFIYLFLDDVE